MMRVCAEYRIYKCVNIRDMTQFWFLVRFRILTLIVYVLGVIPTYSLYTCLRPPSIVLKLPQFSRAQKQDMYVLKVHEGYEYLHKWHEN